MRKRTSPVTENVFFFPEEILYEILSWLGVESLLRCKSVCKAWCAVVKNNHFVEMHTIRNGHRYSSMRRRFKILNTDGIQEKIRYLCLSCRGFLLVEKVSLASAKPSYAYRIINPTTNRILDLPHPRKVVQTMLVFLNTSTSSYNVVSVYFDRENNNHKLELIDLGGQSNDPCPNADLSWKILNIAEFDKLGRQLKYFFLYCMSIEGVLFILALHTVESSNRKLICADLVRKTCTTFDAPQSLRFKWHEFNFQLYRGKPSVSFFIEEKLNVLVLEDYKMQKWADKLIVIPMPFLKQNPYMKDIVPYIFEDNGKESIVFRTYSRSYLVYKHESQELCTVPSVPVTVPATLVSVKGMQPRRNKDELIFR